MQRKMKFLNNDKTTGNLQALANALSNNKSKDSTNYYTPITAVQGSKDSDDNLSDGIGSLFTNGLKAYNAFKGDGSSSTGLGNGLGTFGSSADAYISGFGTSSNGLGTIGNAANSFISGSGASSGSAITDAISSAGSSGSGTTLFGGVSNIGGDASASGGLGSSFGGGMPWATIANAGKGIYNGITGKDPSEYSDVEQSVIYPLQGAANGSMFGPWGALGGALYGLGYSFKDDLGLDDSNFLTQLLFPIGMGDGGGLRINGESILDIL